MVLLGDFSPRPETCGDLQGGAAPLQGAFLVGWVTAANPPEPLAVGQFNADLPVMSFSPGQASVSLYTSDGNLATNVANSVSGTLNLTQISPTLAGNFSVVLALGDGGTFDLSDTFDAPWCGPTP
jgi:hypothetical protein